MRIMILNGSPKRAGSDTMCITRAFVEGINWFTHDSGRSLCRNSQRKKQMKSRFKYARQWLLFWTCAVQERYL